MADAGRGLGRLEEERAGARMLVEGAFDCVDIDRLAPLDVDVDRRDPVGLADVRPALAEFSAADADRFVAAVERVGDRALHVGCEAQN